VPNALVAKIPRLGGGLHEMVPEGPLLWRLAVPGWAQLYCGREQLGRALMAGYAFFLLGAAIFIGTSLGSVLLGLAATCHAASIVDIANMSGGEWLHRVGIFAGYLVTVALAVYLPAGWLLTRVAVPRVVNASSPVFQSGDVVLYAPTSTGLVPPAVGQMTLYRLPDFIIPDQANHRNYQVGGERIDRILAGPGQHVVWREGQLEVDGQPSLLVPVDPARCPPYFETTTPSGHFLILPSTLGVNMGGLPGTSDLTRICLIPSRDVLGRVYWRQQPISRMGWIQ
jgi:type IV secretory pathway protease TraF